LPFLFRPELPDDVVVVLARSGELSGELRKERKRERERERERYDGEEV